MEKKKTITLTLIGMFIFLFGVIGLTYAYWSRTLTQEDQNLVYSDCLKLDVSWGEHGFTLTNAYPMTNDELVNDFFPSQEPYTFTITNSCNKEVPVSINMESLTAEEPELKDDYVDVILWEKKDTETNVFVQDTDTVLSHQGSRIEIGSEDPKPSYKLTDNKENSNKLIKEAKSAYQLYKFVLASKATKEFNLLLFMDYDTPVSTSENVTNNANWAGKITLNNYVTKPTLIETIQTLPVQKEDSGNSGIYLVDHTEAEITWEGTEDQKTNLQQTEYRYAGPNYKDENTDYVHNYVNIDGQTWRIIGLVNTPEGQRVKLVKDESIGNYSWDTSAMA